MWYGISDINPQKGDLYGTIRTSLVALCRCSRAWYCCFEREPPKHAGGKNLVFRSSFAWTYFSSIYSASLAGQMGIFEKVNSLKKRFWELGTAAMRNLPPEFAHDMGIACLKYGVIPRTPSKKIADRAMREGVNLETSLPGLGKVPHPIGLAAGFDKDADCIAGCENVGFSFVEIGTVTPLPQPGNQRPRLWRQKEEHALINAMGFNNHGAAKACEKVMRAKNGGAMLPVGVNIGKNKITTPENALNDYAHGFATANSVANFFVVNISSPNTPGLRDLATPEFIRHLAQICDNSQRTRTWIKLSPDMERTEFQTLIEAVMTSEFAGVVLSNTHKVDNPHIGGMSGAPILKLSNLVLEWSWDVHQGTLPTIATGGVFSGADALAKIQRGASAIELLTAFIYRGPLAVSLIARELSIEMKLRGFSDIAAARGTFFETRQ